MLGARTPTDPDAMDALTALHTRNSAPSLVDPAPGPEAREAIFTAALRAPDHARLRPWRFHMRPRRSRATSRRSWWRCAKPTTR